MLRRAILFCTDTIVISANDIVLLSSRFLPLLFKSLFSQSVVNHRLGVSCAWSSTPQQIIVYGPVPGTWSNTPGMVCILLLLFSPSSCCFHHQTPVGVVSSEQLLVHPAHGLAVCETWNSILSMCLCLSGRLLYQWQRLLVVRSGKPAAVSCRWILLSHHPV